MWYILRLKTTATSSLDLCQVMTFRTLTLWTFQSFFFCLDQTNMGHTEQQTVYQKTEIMNPYWAVEDYKKISKCFLHGVITDWNAIKKCKTIWKIDPKSKTKTITKNTTAKCNLEVPSWCRSITFIVVMCAMQHLDKSEGTSGLMNYKCNYLAAISERTFWENKRKHL